MASIVTTLKAGNNVRTFRQPIDDLAFTFVAPLSADNYYIGHDLGPFFMQTRDHIAS
jgi:hypothetical protein